MTDSSDSDEIDDGFQWVSDTSNDSSESDESPSNQDTPHAETPDTASHAETSDDSRVDDFLERFEAQESDSQPISTEQQQSTAPTKTKEAKTKDRLWNSFGSESTTETDTKAQTPTDQSTEKTEFDNELPGESFAESQKPADQGTTTTTTETDQSTSFETILNRISHRTGGANQTDTQETATTESGSTRSGGSTRSRSTQSEAIDEVLNNIDLFGRATSSSQVLLLTPTAHSITNDIYTRFLLPTDGAGQNVLFVSATQSADDQLPTAEKISSWEEGQTAVIEVGQRRLEPSQTGQAGAKQLNIYKQVSNLQNLAKLGVNISHTVSQWSDNRRPTVVGVHTLSAIQQYVGNETMFQFLFTLKGQLNSLGVMGFYHMNPVSHTTNEIKTIKSAFDLVIQVSADGSVSID